MAQGWISLYRSLMDNWIYDDGTPFDHAHAWIDLLLLAAHEDHKFMYQGNLYESKRGQVNRSLRSLAERWHWSRGKVGRFLGCLEKDGMIKLNVEKMTTITIENYSKYQNMRATDGPPTDQPRATDGPPTDTYNNVNNEDNVNNVNIGRKAPRFTPPDLADVKAYCMAQGYEVDAERFIDFYESKGWMVGKNKMKDWRAAVRGWAKRSKEDAAHPRSMEERIRDL